MTQIDERPRSAWTARRDRSAPETPRSPWRRRVGIAGAALGLVLALISILTAGLAIAHRGAALPGTSVDGADVSRLDPAEVRQVVAGIVADRQNEAVILHHEGEEFSFTPGSASYEADIDEAVTEVMAVGRDRNLLLNAWTHLSTLWSPQFEITITDDVFDTTVRTWVAGIADRLDHDPSHGRVTADADSLEVRIEYPGPGEHVRRDEAVAMVLDAVRSPGEERLPLPVDHLPQEVSDADVEQVAALAERAIAEPLTLRINGDEVVFAPADLARLIDTRDVEIEDGRTLVLDVPVGAAEEMLAPYEMLMTIEPTDARFGVGGPFPTFDPQGDATWRPVEATIEITPSTSGTRFDPEAAATQLTGLLSDAVREADLELETVEADLTTQDARDLNINSLIGTFTTYHACCQTRVQNIQRMADLVRGALLAPGESLSLNEHVGRRTVARGFAEGGTIVAGEFVSEVGGGVSQFATTMYNAAFFAGIEIMESKAHSYYISRYPMGREATIYYPSVDLKIRNTTESGILVHTRYTGTSITVSLFGDNGDLTVRAQHGQAHNHRSRGEIVRENKDLRPGTERVIQGSAEGFDVVVQRHMTQPDGEVRTERIFTRYQPQPRIVERNSDPAPEPSPSPSPTPSPGGGGGGGDGGGNGGDSGDNPPDDDD